MTNLRMLMDHGMAPSIRKQGAKMAHMKINLTSRD